MTQVQGPPPGTTVVDDPPATSGSGRGRRRDPAPKVKLGPGRWFREVGWRHLVGVIAVLWALFPVSYLVSASLNPLGNVVTSTMIPQAFSLANFTTLLDEQPFGTWYRNSIIVCVCVVFVQLLFSALAAFAFSRFRFTGRRGGLLALLLIQMFPQLLASVALFLMLTDIEGDPRGRSRHPRGLHPDDVGGSLGAGLADQGVLRLHPDVARRGGNVDGASHVQMYYRIILPLVRRSSRSAACSSSSRHRGVPDGVDLPARLQQQDPGHRALRPHRRRPVQQPWRLRGGVDHDRDPGGAAVPLPAEVHRRSASPPAV